MHAKKKVTVAVLKILLICNQQLLMNEVKAEEEGCRRSQISTTKVGEELKKKKEEELKLTEVLSETLIKPFSVNSEQPQTSVIQIPKLKELEQENCNSSQLPSPLMKRPSSVFVKNIPLSNQNRQKPPFRDAKLKAKTFAKEVLIAA